MEIICIQNKCVVPDKEDMLYEDYMKHYVQLQLQEHDWANETYVDTRVVNVLIAQQEFDYAIL